MGKRERSCQGIAGDVRLSLRPTQANEWAESQAQTIQANHAYLLTSEAILFACLASMLDAFTSVFRKGQGWEIGLATGIAPYLTAT